MLVTLHTILVVAHLLAIAIGLGAALVADWVVLKAVVSRNVSAAAASLLHDLSRTVSFGLVLLWATGALLVWDDLRLNPAFLWNEKVWAKVAIVGALTLNAPLLHYLVLPLVGRQVGRSMFFGLKRRVRIACTMAAAVSIVSWVFALVLGAARELNGVVTMFDVLTVYAAAVTLAWSGGTVLNWLVGLRGLPAAPALGELTSAGD